MNLIHRKQEPVRLHKTEHWTVRLNRWAMMNFGYLLVIITILSLLTFMGFCFIIVGNSCLESGNYYNHINDCLTIRSDYLW